VSYVLSTNQNSNLEVTIFQTLTQLAQRRLRRQTEGDEMHYASAFIQQQRAAIDRLPAAATLFNTAAYRDSERSYYC
jgi:hypothetical protein